MTRYAVLLALCLSGAVQGQAQSRPPQEVWNELYGKGQAGQFRHSEFLAERIKPRKPGRVLDIGLGEGRNALFLATQGWRVTGFDISDVAVKLVRELAEKTGSSIEAEVADADRFDYGKQQWDLVCGMYMHDLITRNADKIAESMAPGALLVVEGFLYDPKRQSVEGGAYGYHPNELLRAFDGLRVLHYEEAMATPYWLKEGPQQGIVRFAAMKP